MAKSVPNNHAVSLLPAHLSTIYISVMVTVYLFSVPSAGYAEIVQWKYCLFLWLTGGYLILTLLLKLELRLLGLSIGSLRHRPFSVTLCLLLYLIFTIVSACASPYTGTFLGNARCEGMLTIGLYVGTALCLMRHFQPNRWLLPVFGVSVSLFCLFGLVQLTGANPLGLFPDGYNFYDAGIAYNGQYWSTIGNTNLCSALLSLVSGLFLAVALRGSNKKHRMALIPGCLSIFSILELNAEAGLVALLLGLIILPPVLVRSGQQLCNALLVYGFVLLILAVSRILHFYDGGIRLEPDAWAFATWITAMLLAGVSFGLRRCSRMQNWNPRRLQQVLVGVSFGVIAAGLIVLYACRTLPTGFLSEAHQLLHGHWDDSFGSGRLCIWRQVCETIQQRPLLGGGPDTLRFRGLTGFSWYSVESAQTITTVIDAAHNEFLNILVNQGALSLLSYLAVLLLSVLVWIRSNDHARGIAGAAVLFYCIQSFFGISMCLTAPYFWISLGILHGQNCCISPHCSTN